ncbi:MAG: isocitrate lyase/PEP mutase family protein [Stellaceae bacterium]
MTTPAKKSAAFRALHERLGAFVIPNPWDAGTARLFASLGFEALATTSLGLANMPGRVDSTVSLAEILDNCRAIAAATPLPINADLENCGGDAPELAAKAIGLAAAAGASGGSIEDFTGDRDKPIYDFTLAVERVRAAVEAARALPVPFLLTARAENLIVGYPDRLDDTIRRLQAFEAAGADVLYAPGLRDIETIRVVCAAVTKPVNVVMTYGDPKLTVADLAAAGVKRISVGGSVSRWVLTQFMKVAHEMKAGGFTFVPAATGSREFREAFAKGS